MKELALTAHNTPEQRIKEYLEQNASDALADKINNGTPLTKDGKQLIMRKTLQGFYTWATSEARKLAEKGAIGAWVDDQTVFGWAIHYFEEESIQGELFNLDGTPYKASIKPKAEQKAPTKPKQAPVGASISAKPKIDSPAETDQVQMRILHTPAPDPEPKPEPERKPKTKTKKTTDTAQISLFDMF